MIRPLTLAAIAVLAVPVQAQPQQGSAAVPAPIVFVDIAGPDYGAQTAFYQAVFHWKIGPMGAISAPIPAGATLSGLLRIDPAEKVGLSTALMTLTPLWPR